MALIEALVAAGILTIVGLVTIQVLSAYTGSQRATFSARASLDIDQALRATLAAFLRSHISLNGGCNASSVDFSLRLANSDITVTRSSNIVALPTSASPGAAAAQLRCSSRPARAPGTSGDYYFCFSFGGNGRDGNKKSTMLRSDFAFGEAAFSFLNLATGAPALCSDFAARAYGAGGLLSYALYFGVKEVAQSFQSKTNFVRRILYVPNQ